MNKSFESFSVSCLDTFFQSVENFSSEHLWGTLKNLSKDDSNKRQVKNMTESELKAISFDSLKEAYIRRLKVEGFILTDTLKSNDALYVCEKNEELFFIEFKNGKISKEEQYSIRKKIYDSTLIFTDVFDLNISWMRKFVKYILVYNHGKNKDSEGFVSDSEEYHGGVAVLGKLASKEEGGYKRFGVTIFENYCFNNVYTYTEKQFQEKFLEKYEKLNNTENRF